MDTSLKNLLGLSIIITLIGALILGSLAVRTYDRTSSPTNFRSFTVQGEWKAVWVPDIAEFSFDVITEGGADIATLQKENADKMNRAIDFVKKQGVDKKDISTTQYSIQPRYEISDCVYGSGKPCPPARIVGYTVQQSAHVKIRDFAKISPLLTGVVTSGANAVSDLRFSLDDPSKVENEARAEAIKKAQEKAKETAKAGDFSLGRLLEISEVFSTPFVQQRMMKTMEDSGADRAPTIEPGSQEMHIQVILKYEIN